MKKKIVKESLNEYQTTDHWREISEMNVHLDDFSGTADFTLEFNVKNPNVKGVPEDVYEYEFETGRFINSYAEQAYNEILKIKMTKFFKKNRRKKYDG